MPSGGPSAQRKELRGALPGAQVARASSRWDLGDPGAAALKGKARLRGCFQAAPARDA